MNSILIQGQLSFSTADIEQSQFAGEFGPVAVFSHVISPPLPLQAGEYRVIDGELFEVVDERPPVSNELPQPRTEQ